MTSEKHTSVLIDAPYVLCCAGSDVCVCVCVCVFSSREWDNVDRSVRGRLQNRSEDGEFW